MKFSERSGYQNVRTSLQVESIDVPLRNLLWSIFSDTVFDRLSNSPYNPEMYNYARDLWFNFFKLPFDRSFTYGDKSVHSSGLQKHLRDFFFDTSIWYNPYDLLEFSVPFAPSNFQSLINSVLDREKSGYKFIDGKITPITSELEISELETSLNGDDQFNPVEVHIRTALSLLSDREHPDYRNSIKESISGVESMCKIFSKNSKATLGETLTLLEKQGHLHPALKKAFSSLYGYTSDDGGIRHALIEGDRIIDFHEAKFMLVTCSTFVNFLKSRM